MPADHDPLPSSWDPMTILEYFDKHGFKILGHNGAV